MGQTSPLLNALRFAFPHLSRIKSLEKRLLDAGWAIETENLPPVLARILEVIPASRRLDTKHHVLKVLRQTSDGGEIWVLLQQSSIRKNYMNMIAFYDFHATASIDPRCVSEIVGFEPSTVRRNDGIVWEKQASDKPPGLMINVVFTPSREPHTGKTDMVGARIIAGVTEAQ